MSIDVEREQSALRHLLVSRAIAFEEVDGVAPANRERRNALFAVSGVRGKYPQVFADSFHYITLHCIAFPSLPLPCFDMPCLALHRLALY